MAKYEFVKEIKINGMVFYYTKKDGAYVSDSLSSDEQIARDTFNRIVEGGSATTNIILETREI